MGRDRIFLHCNGVLILLGLACTENFIDATTPLLIESIEHMALRGGKSIACISKPPMLWGFILYSLGLDVRA